jgi:medium-chain acyl-[acyl-carrier-protein] hydrolase
VSSTIISPMRLPVKIPEEAFRDQLRVRSYEVGRLGVIGLGTALRYCESLATDASAAIGFDRSWYVTHHTAWVVREMTLVLGALPAIGEDLRLATWVSEFRRVQAQREYAIWRAATGRMVVRASARWAYCDTLRGQLTRISDEIIEAMKVPGCRMVSQRPHSLLAARSQPPVVGMSSMLQLQARHYETDTQQHINNCVYADWLDEAFYQAVVAARIASPVESLHPRFFRIEYTREVMAGDSLRIETQMQPVPEKNTHRIATEYSIVHIGSNTAAVRAYSEHRRQSGPSRPMLPTDAA